MSTVRSWSSSAHLVCVLAIAAGVITLRVTLASHYKSDLHIATTSAIRRGADDRQAVWQRLSYLDLTNTTLAEVLDRSIDWQNLELRPEQISKLRARLAEVATYFEEPTFERYMHLRTNGLSAYLVRSKFGTNSTVKPNGAIHSNTVEAFSISQSLANEVGLGWTNIHTREGRLSPPRIEAMCPDKVAFELSRTNDALRFPASRAIGKGLTAAVEHINPGFAYGDRKAHLAYNAADGPFFHLSIYIRTPLSNAPGPMYLSLCWLPQEDNWCLSGLVTDACLRISTIF